MRRRDPVEILDDALREIGNIAIPPNEDAAPYAVQMQQIAQSARLRAGRLRRVDGKPAAPAHSPNVQSL